MLFLQPILINENNGDEFCSYEINVAEFYMLGNCLKLYFGEDTTIHLKTPYILLPNLSQSPEIIGTLKKIYFQNSLFKTFTHVKFVPIHK